MSLSPQQVDFEKIWRGLEEGVRKIVTMEGVKGMPMIEDIYKLCTAQPQPHSEELYLRLKQFLEGHVDRLRDTMLELQGDILGDYLKKWTNYSTGTLYIHHIFRYLNMNWIRKRLEDTRHKLGGIYQGPTSTTEVYEVQTLALVIWRDRLFNRVKERLVRSMLELIRQERDGEMINQSEVAGVVQSFVKLGSINKHKQLELYKEDFEVPYLASTREYYTRESTTFIASNGVSAYMKKAEERLEEEALRAKRYLDPSSCDRLKKEVDMVLVDRHKELLQVECEAYLRDYKRDDLSRMYRLLSRIESGIRPMLDVLQNYVTARGLDSLRAIPEDKLKDARTYVDTLLAVYSQFSDVVRNAFNNDPAFVAGLDKACRTVVNDTTLTRSTTRAPELLAKYTDLLLKKGAKNYEGAELEEKIQQVLTLFKFVDDRDVFQKFYSKMLARRLIHGTSVSDDAEAYMIGGLKQVCGYEYTSKLQRMFTDIANSTELNDKFKDYITAKGVDLGVDFSILVLTAGSWPLQAQASNFAVPLELEPCVTQFLTFYSAQYQGRRINWLHHLSKGDLRTGYLKKKYELQVSVYQMSVLLQFNKSDALTTEDFARTTSLKEGDLKRTLSSLVESKILQKSPPEGDISDTDVFTLNTSFQSKRLKIKVASSVQRETTQENEDTHKSIDEDRKLYLQAAIVRIMKARKVLTHANLVKEVIEQARVRFQPSIPMIKKCIEHLIEKEYLQRVEGESNKYSYVA